MKYIGLGLILLGAYLLMRRGRLKLEEEVGFIEEMASLFGHIKRRVSAYFESPREWAASYEAKDGEIAIALSEIRDGASPSNALYNAVKSRKIQHGSYEVLHECISMLGRDDLSVERESISKASERLSLLARTEREQATETSRVRSVLFVFVSLGALIILI